MLRNALSPSFRSQPTKPLAGSRRLAFTGPLSPLPINPIEVISVSVILRPSQPITAAGIKRASAGRQRLSREEFAARHGASSADMDQVRLFAAEYGLQVDEAASSAARRTMVLTGPISAMQEAFKVTLVAASLGNGTCRVREGEIHLPEGLEGVVEAVLGLDNRPQARPHIRLPRIASTSYTPSQVAHLYGLPKGATATGEMVAIIELGGGFVESDITSYFSSLGLSAPSVTEVSVDGGKNSPGDPNGADGEVMLDIEVVGAVAPGVALAVYFAPNTDQGFLDAITTAVHDTTNKPSIVSISWGGPESNWTAQAMKAMDSAFQAAALLGVTVTVAAGDNGSTDGVADGANHVDFPASSPHALACGGTRVTENGGVISSEIVWNELAISEGATGGGVSDVFPLPSWQAAANVPAPTTASGGRGVPDVAGDADPSTGYQVRVDGQNQVIGGTSAVAPLWAGLLAIANKELGTTAGFINPTIYSSGGAKAFRDITSGNNGAFAAGPGWDACTGMGSPKAANLIALLKSPVKG
ncbi:MAG: S53 family peptidase [Acidobacteriaceae bacterium]